jgi:hypothetical protein
VVRLLLPRPMPAEAGTVPGLGGRPAAVLVQRPG